MFISMHMLLVGGGERWGGSKKGRVNQALNQEIMQKERPVFARSLGTIKSQAGLR